MSADTASAPPQLRPLALGEILDVSIKLVRRSFKAVALAVLVVGGVVAVIDVLLIFSTTTYNSATGRTSVGDAAAVGSIVVFLLLFVGAYILATVACFGAIADAYLGRTPSWKASLRFAARRGLSALWLGIVMTVLLVIAFVLLIVPYIYLQVAWSVAFPVLLLEGVGGFKALRRSHRLVRGSWWRTFGTLLVAYLITFVVGVVTQVAVSAVAGAVAGDGSALAVIIEEVANVAVQIVTLPFFAAVLIVLYVDLRVRKEGFDLHLLAEHIAHPGQPASYGVGAPGASPAGWPATDEPAPSSSLWRSPGQPGSTPPPGLDAPEAPRPSDPSPEPPRHPAFGE